MEKTTLDIVMRENDFVIYKDNNPLFTPLGNEIAHTNARLLRHIVTQEILGFSDKISILNFLFAFIDSKNINRKISEQEINFDPLISNSQNLSWLNNSFLLSENFGLLYFIFLILHLYIQY